MNGVHESYRVRRRKLLEQRSASLEQERQRLLATQKELKAFAVECGETLKKHLPVNRLRLLLKGGGRSGKTTFVAAIGFIFLAFIVVQINSVSPSLAVDSALVIVAIAALVAVGISARRRYECRRFLKYHTFHLIQCVGRSGDEKFPYRFCSCPASSENGFTLENWRGWDIAPGVLAISIYRKDEGVALLYLMADQTFTLLNFSLNRSFPRAIKKLHPEVRSLIDRFRAHVLAFQQNQLDSNSLSAKLRELPDAAASEAAWSSIFIAEEALDRILNLVDMFRFDDPAAPRGLLMYGPPGTGKTLIARTIAQTAGCGFIPVSLPDLKAGYIGQSGQKVRKLWQKARNAGKAIIFVDECEAVFGHRGGTESDTFVTDIVQAFLAEWDGIHSSGQIWVIGATNRRDLIDEAIFSRFGQELEIALPDEHKRALILNAEMEKVSAGSNVPAEVISRTQGLSGRDLANLARQVTAKAYPDRPQLEHFMAVLKEMKVRGSTEVDGAATWDNLALDEKTLKFLKETSERLKFAETFAKQGITPPRGILLCGPPGTGKTQIARTLAHETGLRFIGATTADLKANYLGQSGNKVRELFERARANAPAIVFIDELDVVAPVRGTHNDPMTQEIIGQLLQETDGIKRQQASVFIIGATNYPKMVDAAVLDRLPIRIEISLPDLASRRKLLEIHLRSKPVGFSLDKLQKLAETSDGKSGCAIRDWVEAAIQGAVSRAIRDGAPEKVSIKIEDFDSLESATTS